MVCSRVSFENFRNIERASLEFSPGTNLLLGENAQGKTAALEGIYLFARGKSFRGAKDAEMIQFGSEYAGVGMECDTARRPYSMKIAFNASGKRVCRRNGVDIGHLSEFIGFFRAVLFCPAHLSIVQNGPSARRSFLDLAIAQIRPGYVALLQKYNSVLAQRNTLIKNQRYAKSAFDETISAWSAQLAHCAGAISAERDKYVARLNEYARQFMLDMTTGAEKCGFEYVSRKSEQDYLRELTSNLQRELRYGATLYGTHKDDIEITLNGHSARSFSSQGQQRSIALAMKLAEGEISRETSGEQPVYLFDDILSELDCARREYVAAGLPGRQTFITSCGPEGLEGIANAKKYIVRAGTYTGA